MAESDSGVDTGSESNESNSMSVGSPLRSSDDDKDINDFVQKPDLPAHKGYSYTVFNMTYLRDAPMVDLEQAKYNYGFSDYRQQEQVRKLKAGLQRKSHVRFRDQYIARTRLGERTLRAAVSANAIALVRDLLDNNMDPRGHDSRQRTALHLAAAAGHIEIAKMLLDSGADPNQRDAVGNTPLHLAACTTNIGMVTLLLKAGTDVNALDNSGRTPFHLAQSKLKLLQRNTEYSSDELKREVIQVLEMMQVYLHRSGRVGETVFINAFSDRLHYHQTREEVDADVTDLLSNLSHLSLQPA